MDGGDHPNGHANKKMRQLVLATCGSFSITLDDGQQKRTVFLNRANRGLLIKPGIWPQIDDFSSGAICLVLASQGYSEEDYIRNYDDFLRYVKKQRNYT